MEVLKHFGKFLLAVLTLVFTILLSLDILIYIIRDMSSHYFKEETIKEMLSTVDFTDLLLDSNGNELKQITEIKNELIEAGIPVEVIEELLDSKPVKEVTSNIIQVGVDYVIYDKEIETPNISVEDVYKFFEENLPIVVKELQANNVPKSELLTVEKQEMVLQQIKENAPIIEEKVNEVVNKALEEIQKMDEYQQLENYKNKAYSVLDMIQYIYSKSVTNILLIVGIVCTIFIMLSRRSFYKGFKWIGFSFILSGSMIYLLKIFLPFIQNEMVEVPYIFSNFVTYIFEDIQSLGMHNGFICFIIATIFMIANMVGYIIYEKRDNKKFEI